MFRAAFLDNKVPHSAISTLHWTESDLRFHQVTGARASVHIETYSK